MGHRGANVRPTAASLLDMWSTYTPRDDGAFTTVLLLATLPRQLHTLAGEPVWAMTVRHDGSTGTYRYRTTRKLVT